jgi:hypothetical protein
MGGELSLLAQEPLEIAGIILSGEEGLVLDQPQVQGQGRLDSFEPVFLKRSTTAHQGLVAVRPVDYKLAHHRVVERRDLVARKDARPDLERHFKESHKRLQCYVVYEGLENRGRW